MIKRMLDKLKAKRASRTWEGKNRYLREKGAIIGEGTRLNCSISSFGTEPYLITVGKNCLFADGVRFITHDGGVMVLKNLGYFDKSTDKLGTITIGNNVYVGMGAIIMPSVRIGDNVIIGAQSVVTRDVPDNCVAAGIPAHVIESITTYAAKERSIPNCGAEQRRKIPVLKRTPS